MAFVSINQTFMEIALWKFGKEQITFHPIWKNHIALIHQFSIQKFNFCLFVYFSLLTDNQTQMKKGAHSERI